MVHIKSFKALRPDENRAYETAALPYDVFDEDEARREVERSPKSFLRIDRPETAFPEGCDMYAPEVYEKAKEILDEDIKEGIYKREKKDCFYVYSLTMDGRRQTGLAACVSIDDYICGAVKKHENTVREKEEDRVRHISALEAQTGPIFLLCKKNERLSEILKDRALQERLYSFVSDDGIGHELYRISDESLIREITEIFERDIPAVYIADGHHRAASAVRASLKKRAEEKTRDPGAEYNFFLSVIFPDDELKIFDYNRVVKDTGGLKTEDILSRLEGSFDIRETDESRRRPEKKGEIGMYLSDTGRYFILSLKPEEAARRAADPVESLDVAVLQDLVLSELFSITDPRGDKRVEFVGGIRGEDILKEKADSSGGAAFLMYPTSVDELMRVADAGLLMPPKSTWFEPKLRSGLLIHEF